MIPDELIVVIWLNNCNLFPYLDLLLTSEQPGKSLHAAITNVVHQSIFITDIKTTTLPLNIYSHKM